jgi:isopenicillin N synthase-like dioxygenase
LLRNLVVTTHSIGTTILAALSTALGLPESLRFEKFHGADTLSNSTLACNKHPKHNVTDPNIGHNAHTDIGTVTILFTPQWGLQALPPGTDKWAFIQPLPEHAVIVVGDSLRHMSQNKIRPCLHRVVPIPGTIEQEDRYSFMYFLRPDRDAVFRDSEGNEYTSEQWHQVKTANFRKNHDSMASSLQTGQAGYLGLWDTTVVSTVENGS